MITALIIFTIANIVMAFVDSRKINKGKWVKHGINGALYIAIVAIPYFIFNNWWLVGALLFNRLLVFNIALSLFRGLKWDYITPEKPPKAITDKLAKMVFGMNGKLMYGVYLVIFIAFLVIIF